MAVWLLLCPCTLYSYTVLHSCMLLTKSVALESEGSSLHSQKPATGPYPELGKSTPPHPPSQCP
jgi:hypothetical protein